MQQADAIPSLEELLRTLVAHRGSDLHLTAGSPPRLRIHGALHSLETPSLGPDDSRRMIYSILTNQQIAKFEQEHELDTAFGLSGVGRFRVNVYYQRGTVASALRLIPFKIQRFRPLGLPEKICRRLCQLTKGLVLVTGATGSGKSTTLAAMIDYINENDSGHILTIEDPIEFLHQNKRCLVNQREVGPDTKSFNAALRHVLRQDPDTVLIGEMRDMETIELGLKLAETGHLTFATLHTSDAVQTINRIIDVFPSDQQAQVRTQLSFVLEGVLAQMLVPLASGQGRTVAIEILLANAAVRANIRDDKMHHVYSLIQTGGKDGMQTMNAALAQRVMDNMVTLETALEYSPRPDELTQLLAAGHPAATQR